MMFDKMSADGCSEAATVGVFIFIFVFSTDI
jgi:hypothetical protein